MGKRTRFAAVLGSLFAIYIIAYLVLSSNGRFEPSGIGLNGVKSHTWAPCGFYAELKWRRGPMIFFSPLYLIDESFWHTHDAANSGRYPITEVDPADIWKYYKAAGFFEESEESSEETKSSPLSNDHSKSPDP